MVGGFSGASDGRCGLVVYGGSPWGFILQIGLVQGLAFVDPVERKAVLATDSWTKLAEQIVGLVRSGALQFEPMENRLNGDAFRDGRSAFMLETESYGTVLKQENKDTIPHWRAMPLSRSQGAPPSIRLEEIIAIPKNGNQSDQAADVIAFLVGEKMRKIMDRQGHLATRKPPAEHGPSSLGGLYELSANPQSGAISSHERLLESLPESFRVALYSSGTTEIANAINGKQSVEEALIRIEQAAIEAWPAS